MSKVKVFRKIKYKYPEKMIRIRLGYRSRLTRLNQRAKALMKEAKKEALSVIKPVVIYRDLKIKRIGDDKVYLEDKIVFKSRSIAKLLQGCEKATVFAVTIGPELGKLVSVCFRKRERAKGVIIDAIGSEVADEIADELNERLNVRAKKSGWVLTRRFSPGYGDFSLSNQKVLFKVLNLNKYGVKLSKSYIMKPEKSVTAILGWKSERR